LIYIDYRTNNSKLEYYYSSYTQAQQAKNLITNGLLNKIQEAGRCNARLEQACNLFYRVILEKDIKCYALVDILNKYDLLPVSSKVWLKVNEFPDKRIIYCDNKNQLNLGIIEAIYENNMGITLIKKTDQNKILAEIDNKQGSNNQTQAILELHQLLDECLSHYQGKESNTTKISIIIDGIPHSRLGKKALKTKFREKYKNIIKPLNQVDGIVDKKFPEDKWPMFHKRGSK